MLSENLMIASTDLILGFKKMSKCNDVIKDTHGNLSVRVNDVVIIKPSGMEYDSINLDDLCYYDINSNRTTSTNNRKPSVDLSQHVLIYKQNKDIKSICHTHSPYATSIGTGDFVAELPVIFTEHADYFGECIPITYSTNIEWAKDSSYEYSRKARGAMILQNHGTVSWGESPNQAVKLAVALENIAFKFHLLVSRNIEKIDEIIDKCVLDEETVKEFNNRYWNVYGQ